MSKSLTMAQVRATVPQYFSANVPALIKGLSDSSARVHALALALTGAALERAQSGNTPALAGADSALETLKGKGLRSRVDAALSIVRTVPARSGSSWTAEEWKARSEEFMQTLSQALTPPEVKKAEKPAPKWKELYAASHAAHVASLEHVALLEEALSKAGASVPARPVGIAPVTVPA